MVFPSPRNLPGPASTTSPCLSFCRRVRVLVCDDPHLCSGRAWTATVGGSGGRTCASLSPASPCLQRRAERAHGTERVGPELLWCWADCLMSSQPWKQSGGFTHFSFCDGFDSGCLKPATGQRWLALRQADRTFQGGYSECRPCPDCPPSTL